MTQRNHAPLPVSSVCAEVKLDQKSPQWGPLRRSADVGVVRHIKATVGCSKPPPPKKKQMFAKATLSLMFTPWRSERGAERAARPIRHSDTSHRAESSPRLWDLVSFEFGSEPLQPRRNTLQQQWRTRPVRSRKRRVAVLRWPQREEIRRDPQLLSAHTQQRWLRLLRAPLCSAVTMTRQGDWGTRQRCRWQSGTYRKKCFLSK